MKTTFAAAGAALLLVFTVSQLVSAADAVSPTELAAQKQKLSLAKPPAKAQNVSALRKKLEAAKRPDGSAKLEDVVIAGQIGGMPNPWGETHPDFPWYADQASFFLLDSKVAAQFAKHAKSHGGDVDCPFCRRLATKNVNAIAVVNLVDDLGQIIKVDARELMNLKEGQSVVIRGTAEMLGGNFVVINADGVYARR